MNRQHFQQIRYGISGMGRPGRGLNQKGAGRRTEHMKTLLTLLVSTLVFGSAFAATAARPNIVFILADDLGWKDVGYAGSSFYRTPNIDRLARDGMRFSQAYSAACMCSPSRGAIYSGRNPARTSLTNVFQNAGAPDDVLRRLGEHGAGCQTLAALQRLSLPRSERTFGAVLTEAGYATAFFGKWHCGEIPGYEPDERGWQVAKGYRVAKAGGFSDKNPAGWKSPFILMKRSAK